jgi:ribose 5-phosphate isomerase B
MRIALGCDHRGRSALASVIRHLESRGHETAVFDGAPGAPPDAPRDYPDGAYLVGRAVAEGAADRGVLVCGSGIGMSIAANKVQGVRAALVHVPAQAEATRRHNDANVLCIAGDEARGEEIPRILDAFLTAPFEGGRHARRVEKIAAIERGEDPRGI